MNLTQQFFKATENGDLKSVNKLIKKGADVHAKDDLATKSSIQDQFEICYYAGKHGYREIINQILATVYKKRNL